MDGYAQLIRRLDTVILPNMPEVKENSRIRFKDSFQDSLANNLKVDRTEEFCDSHPRKLVWKIGPSRVKVAI